MEVYVIYPGYGTVMIVSAIQVAAVDIVIDAYGIRSVVSAMKN